jgi:hypothetical protein
MKTFMQGKTEPNPEPKDCEQNVGTSHLNIHPVLRIGNVLSRIQIFPSRIRIFPSRIRIFLSRIRIFLSRIRIFPSRIRIKEFKYFNPKDCFYALRSGSGFFTHPGSRIQGSKRHRIPDPQHCISPSAWSVCTAVASIKKVQVTKKPSLQLSKKAIQHFKT